MAKELNVKRCWFQKNHYDIPKKRIEEIMAKCEVVSTRRIIEVIKMNEIFDELCTNGELKSYHLVDLDEEGNPGKSHFRNTQRLTLEFPSGKKVVIDTFCSGTAENTFLLVAKG